MVDIENFKVDARREIEEQNRIRLEAHLPLLSVDADLIGNRSVSVKCHRSLLLTGTHEFPDRRIIHHNFYWHCSFRCLKLHRHAPHFCNVKGGFRII